MKAKTSGDVSNAGWLWIGSAGLVIACCVGTFLCERADAEQVLDDLQGAGVVGKAHECVGDLEQVADALGFGCPKDFCAAQVLASDCGVLPALTRKTAQRGCDGTGFAGFSFEVSATRRKVCYYMFPEKFGPNPLVGAEAWDDQAHYCSGTAARISGGQLPLVCLGHLELTLCDGSRPEQVEVAPSTPPRACFNDFEHSCDVCCPAAPPDCSDKPHGYPGYQCTSATPGGGSTCRCLTGKWQCMEP